MRNEKPDLSEDHTGCKEAVRLPKRLFEDPVRLEDTTDHKNHTRIHRTGPQVSKQTAGSYVTRYGSGLMLSVCEK